MDELKTTPDAKRAAHLARESKARVAAAWLELIEAAKTEPKARAFLDVFAAEAMRAAVGDAEAVSAMEFSQPTPGGRTSAS